MPGRSVVGFARVKDYLNAIADAHGRISTSPHRRFWNLSYQIFVDGQVPNVTCDVQPVPIIDKSAPLQSPFFLILQAEWCGMPQMPAGGPFITDADFEVDLPDGSVVTGSEIVADLVAWLTNGYPERAPSSSPP
jgi:hypothetical protein